MNAILELSRYQSRWWRLKIQLYATSANDLAQMWHEYCWSPVRASRLDQMTSRDLQCIASLFIYQFCGYIFTAGIAKRGWQSLCGLIELVHLMERISEPKRRIKKKIKRFPIKLNAVSKPFQRNAHFTSSFFKVRIVTSNQHSTSGRRWGKSCLIDSSDQFGQTTQNKKMQRSSKRSIIAQDESI